MMAVCGFGASSVPVAGMPNVVEDCYQWRSVGQQIYRLAHCRFEHIPPMFERCIAQGSGVLQIMPQRLDKQRKQLRL